MQAWNFAILLFAFYTANSKIKDIKVDKTITSLMKDCSKIKCPPVQDPVCARLFYNQTRAVIHVLLINKCEKRYVECYQGVQASLVPIQFCSHDKTQDHKMNVKGKNVGYKRVKRESGGKKPQKKLATRPAQRKKYNASPKRLPYIGSKDKKRDKKRLTQGPAEKNNEHDSTAETFTEIGPAIYATYPKNQDHSLPFPIHIAEYSKFYKSFHWPQSYPKVDMDDYEAECPTVCPIRPVMVCGRCEHGVYMTFLSICHLRMHYCQTKDDNIELISRGPCMMIAPLLKMEGTSHSHEHPSGVVNEPNDDDKVLKYIWCRQLLGTGAYCNRKTNEHEEFSETNEEEYSSISSNTSEEPNNSNMFLNDAVDSDNPDLPMNAAEDSDSPNLLLNAGKTTNN